MSESRPYDASDASSTSGEGLPDWWPPFTGPTIPWRDGEAGRNSALGMGAQHDLLLDAYRALGERNGGGFFGMLRGMLAEYVTRGLVSEKDAQRLGAMLDALQLTDPDEAVDKVLRLHEEATADPDAKPAALAVFSIAAASAARARTDFQVDTGQGPLHTIIQAAADAGGAIITIPMGPPGMIVMATGFSILADSHHVHVEVAIR
jgi:hypothetical protein